MFGTILFALGLIGSLWIGFLCFRDLGDVSQMLLKVKRENMVRFIRNEYRLIAIGLGGFAVATLAHFLLGGGPFWLWLVGALLVLILYGFPYVWVHLGLRKQRSRARPSGCSAYAASSGR